MRREGGEDGGRHTSRKMNANKIESDVVFSSKSDEFVELAMPARFGSPLPVVVEAL
jgi:hypothetical protein